MFQLTKRYHVLLFVLICAVPIVTAYSLGQISVEVFNEGHVSSSYEVYAASGSVTAIQQAVDDVIAHGGGTVRIPEGDFLFDATPSSYVHSIGGVSIIGAGMFKTNLTLAPSRTYPSTTMFYVDGSNQQPLRISGITFIGRLGAAASATGDTGIELDVCKDFRIDHCSFHKLGSNGIFTHSFSNDDRSQWLLSQGVIDHNQFIDIYKPDALSAWVGFGYGIDIEKNWDSSKTPWPTDINQLMGNATDTVFVEDNFFTGCRHTTMTWLGGRTVYRYNTIDHHAIVNDAGHWMIDMHPPRGDGTDYYGGRWYEIYGNTLNGNAPDYHWGITIDGGSALITNNTMTGPNLYYAYGFDLTTRGSISQATLNKCKPHDIYIWNNIEYYAERVYNPNPSLVKEGVDYHFEDPATDGYTYTPYAYPHPLTLSG